MIRLSVSIRGYRYLQPEGGGPGLWRTHDSGLGNSGAQHGVDDKKARVGNSPFRPGQQLHQHYPWQPLQGVGVRPSMSSVGDTYYNAMAESLFASLEYELITHCIRKIKAHLAIFTRLRVGTTRAGAIPA